MKKEYDPRELPDDRYKVKEVADHREFSGKLIKINREILNKKPRRYGTQGWKCLNFIESKGGTTSYEEYRKGGCRNQDLEEDLRQGRVELINLPK